MGGRVAGKNPYQIDPWRMNTMSTFLSCIPRQVVDQDKVGDVFILVFKGDVPIRKMAHHALLVDVAGATSESHFCGVLLHLTAEAIDRQTKFHVGDRPWKKTIFYESIYIGKTVPPYPVQMSQPRKWALALQEFVSEIVSIDWTCHNELTHSRDTTWPINWSIDKEIRRGHRAWIVKSLWKAYCKVWVSDGQHSCLSSKTIWSQWSSIYLSDSLRAKQTNYSSKNNWIRDWGWNFFMINSDGYHME